ncbi:MAG: heterocyst frequency control protein PatD [cyanobacterium endosymbiont of Rhopalodia musculus]|uniref:heterocyst frequency control protein PatD n=1 Tax=cyanobacterium endosymbiont of Epithemia clementina EcSB TaxID=3034674 RepID=UPI0024815C51|nr:heterocyst frequency control protein PatD [cyanobacterium endosymbiont of Epithemia clementina EcSB]WGT67731.1 heterocyst frequency control protein PatD [cyanobacterium endosymbiont of Epithemia clementina EcSB]
MLPKSHQKFYQQFFASLITLRDQVMMKNIDSRLLSQYFQVAQEIFQDKILELTTESLENSVVSSWQSTQTEIYRTLRLLRTDLLFLHSSYKQKTEEQRLESVLNHIEKLIGYCQVVLTK